MIDADQEAINQNLAQNYKKNAKICFFNQLISSNEKKNLNNAFSDNWTQIKAAPPNKLK